MSVETLTHSKHIPGQTEAQTYTKLPFPYSNTGWGGKQLEPPCYSFRLSFTSLENLLSHNSPWATPIVSWVWEARPFQAETVGHPWLEAQRPWEDMAAGHDTVYDRTMEGAATYMAYKYCRKWKDKELYKVKTQVLFLRYQVKNSITVNHFKRVK